MKKWRHKVTGTEEKCKLFGVNIFEYEWKNTGEKVDVIDPKYKQKHTFDIYTVEIKGKSKRFAAGEFSCCVWGFYLESIL